MTSQDPPSGPSRRDLLAGAGVIAAGVLLAGCGATSAAGDSHPTVPTQPPVGAAARSDLPVLRAALELERRTVAAYTAAIPLLPGAQATWATTFLNEELQHTGEMISLIRLAGGHAPDPAPSYDIGHPRTATEVLAGLEALELTQLESYARWIPRLSAGTMRAGAASVFANDAQHITALRAARGRSPLGSAFVVGPPGQVSGR